MATFHVVLIDVQPAYVSGEGKLGFHKFATTIVSIVNNYHGNKTNKDCQKQWQSFFTT